MLGVRTGRCGRGLDPAMLSLRATSEHGDRKRKCTIESDTDAGRDVALRVPGERLCQPVCRAYSADLVKWRPQDYPYMEGVNSCIAPVCRTMWQRLLIKCCSRPRMAGCTKPFPKILSFQQAAQSRCLRLSFGDGAGTCGRTAGEGTGIQSAVRRSGAHGAGCGECSILGRTQRRIGAGQ